MSRSPAPSADELVVASPPQLFIHVRVAVCGLEILQLEGLRDALVQLAASLTPDYAIRIKRRKITPEQATALRVVYEARAARTRAGA